MRPTHAGPTLAVDNTAAMRVAAPRSVAEILAEPLPAYVIRPLLARRAVHVVYGDANCGKTFWALDLSARIACGGDWQGKQISSAPVLYVAAEGYGGLPKRLRALVQQYPGLPAAPFRIIRQALDLIEANGDLITRAKDLAEDQGALGLVVLDTLAQTIGGRDENGSDMATYVQRAAALADNTGAPVLIVHHAGKDAQRGARGHSALRGNVDAVYRITADESGVRTVAAEKCRDDTISPFCYTLRTVDVGRDAEGECQTSCIVEYRTDLSVRPLRRPLVGDRQKLLYRLAGEIARASADAGALAANGRPIVETAKLLETWQAAAKAAGTKKTNPGAATSALEALVSGGYLESAGEGTWTLI